MNMPIQGDQPSQSRSWRPQVSLLVLLLLLTIVAFVISHFATKSKYEKNLAEVEQKYDMLSAEHQKLKKAAYVLEPTDRSVVHFIEMPAYEQDTYLFRIYLPLDKKYIIKYATKNISLDDYPKPDGTWGFQPWDLEKTNGIVDLGVNYKYDKIRLSDSFNKRMPYEEIHEVHHKGKRYTNRNYYKFGDVVNKHMENDRVDLIRLNMLYDETGTFKPGTMPDTTEMGILVWIEEVPATKKK